MKRSGSKQFERRVAELFGTQRTPLSGEHSRHTASDTLHETLYIEAKSNIEHPALDNWNDIKERAKRQGIPPLAVLVDPGFEQLWLWHVDLPPVPKGDTVVDHYCWLHYRKQDSLRTLYEEQIPRAKDEGKTPLLAVSQQHRPGFWIVCRPGDVDQICCAM